MHHNKSMYVTNVEKEGPFLKIWGQIDKKSSLEVEQALLRASVSFDQGQFIPKENTLEVGSLYCAKYVDGKYYRAKITSISPINNEMVEVYFTDYGNKDLIPVGNLRTAECFNGWFHSLPPLSTAFILAEVVCIGGEWNDFIVDQISKEIRYMEHNYIIVAQAIRYYFIKLFVHDIDLGLHLVRQNLMQSTAIQTQEAVLLAMIPRAVPSVTPPNQSLLQYKSFTLEPHSQHEVYVSYITDGPSHFSVQLKKYESTLAQLMREINSMPLKPLEELPIPGTVCLAKCVEDNHICRAVVTSEIDSLYKLFYVDFGNTELVPPENLYQMAFKFIIPKIMAIRLSLAGVEKTSITLDMQCAFKHFVDNRLLMMEVLPAAKKMALPKCRMWDPVSNIDVTDVLNRAAQNAYPDLIALHKGFTQLVKVSFVYSCNRFYVQLKSKEIELIQLMKDLQIYGNSKQTCYLAEAKVGQPCCALFSFDQKWYRCVITEIEGTRAKIRYIDFGNEEFVSVDSLKVVDGEYLTILRPQAIECCLNGYQNMTEDQERDLKLEELILEQEFMMKVIDSIGGKTLIDLMDASNTTVTALLLESIMAQAKVQNIVNVPENTKHESSAKRPGLGEERRANDDRNTKQYFHHDDRRSPRGQNWKEKTGDNNSSWRQSPRNRCDSNSNESMGSWRQDNRGFKNRKENDWNDRSNSNSFKERGFRNRFDNGEKERHQRNSNRNTDGNYWNNKKGFRNQSDNVSGNESWIHGRSQRNTNGDRNGSNSRVDRSWTDNQGFKKKYDNEKKDWEKNDNGDFREQNKLENNRNNQNVKGDWNNKTEKGNWNEKTERNNKNKRSETNDWNNKASKGGGDCSENKTYKERNGDWNANKGSSENRIGDRQHNNRGDFKKKSLRREGNEHSSSGSEKSFGRGTHNYSRNDNRPPRADRRFGSKNANNSCDYSVPSVAIDNAPSDAKFKYMDVSERQEKVTISWFHNPCSFFCQLLESQDPFKNLMEEIQQAYKGRPSESCVKGAPVVALFPEDNVLYRATVIEVLSVQYKVHYVDFGNVSVVDKVWPIENKFMEMPMQAIPCGLKSLEPAGDDWPNPDNYSEYFEREDLNCFFSCRDENGRYWVNITVGNEDITQQLVNNALAKYFEPIPSNVEIELFVGQQFRAMLQQVNSCSDFTMILQSGFTFHCSLHNLAAATEINEDLLRQQLEQILIVYADNLVENRLEVTLYDATGSKLNIIEPDEGAYDTVDLPCPYFVVSYTLHGTVSHVTDHTVIIQPLECAQNIEYLLEHLFEYYENLPPADDPLVPEEDSVYAVKSNDGNWYRGKVTTFNDDTVEVTYLDYGNMEQVEFSNLRELIPDHLMWDAQAIAVNVNVPADHFLDQEVIAKINYGESNWEAELQLVTAESGQPISSESQPKEEEVFESNQETNLSLEQTDETITVDANYEPIEIIHAQVEEAVHMTDTAEKAASSLEDKDIICPVGGSSVVLSHIDSPSDFYIQLVDSLPAIDELKHRLQREVGEMTELESVSVGGLCAAPYTLDQQWYRSQILDADDDITTVRFIDFGNTDVISNDVTQLKTLPADLLTLEEYATRCRLKIKSSEEDWSKAAVQRFEELTDIDNLIVEFIDQDEKANYVELYSNGENVKDILIAENLALLDDVVLEGKLTGFVSHINSPSEFWVQLESCCAELEWIAEQLSNAGSFQDLEDLTPGSLCAAMFQDDEMWYRARILSNTVAGLEVLFLDYGNSCVCSNLKQLPEHLVMAPPLAQKCSLQKPEGVTSWSSKASEKFSELSADGKTIFTVRKISTGEASIVELFMNSEEVSTKLLMYNDHDKESDPTVSSVEQIAEVIHEERLEKNISQKNEQGYCMIDDIGKNTDFSETSIEEKEVLLTTETANIELDSEQFVNNGQNVAKDEQKSDGNSEDISLVDCKESTVEKFEKEEYKENLQRDIECVPENANNLDDIKMKNNSKDPLSPVLKEKTFQPDSGIDTIEGIAKDAQNKDETLIENSKEKIEYDNNDLLSYPCSEHKITDVDPKDQDEVQIECSSHDNTIQMIESLVDNIVNSVHYEHSQGSDKKETLISDLVQGQDELCNKVAHVECENIVSYNLECSNTTCNEELYQTMSKNEVDLLVQAICEAADSFEKTFMYTNFFDQEEITENVSTVADNLEDINLAIVENEKDDSVSEETNSNEITVVSEEATIDYGSKQVVNGVVCPKKEIVDRKDLQTEIDSENILCTPICETDSVKLECQVKEDNEEPQIIILNTNKTLCSSEVLLSKTISSNEQEDILDSSDKGLSDQHTNQQNLGNQEHIQCLEIVSECLELHEMKEKCSVKCDEILGHSIAVDVPDIISKSDSNKQEIESNLVATFDDGTTVSKEASQENNVTSRVCSKSTETSPIGTLITQGKEKFEKIEFVDTILTSFSSPTVTERIEVATKLSPTKIVSKSRVDFKEQLKENSSEENVIESKIV